MAVRIKDGMIPYTGGQGIEITNNHVINVLLRKMNNLIMVNEDRELYVDLQLPDGIQPDDDFPVGVTTGKILQEDGRPQSGIILNWKTTSGDYVRLIYANDGKLYYDPGTGQWIEIGTNGLSIGVATSTTLGTIKLGSDTEQTEAPQTPTATANRSYAVQLNSDNQAIVNVPWTDTTYTAGQNITIDNNNEISANLPQALVYKGTVNDLSDLPASGTVGDTYFVEGEDGMYSWDGTQWAYVGGTGVDLSNLFNKLTDNSDDIVQGTTNLFVTQAEKNYWNGKQDRLTAGDGIDITNNVISNDLPFDPSNTGSLGQVLKRTSTGYRWADETGEEYTAGDGINITSGNVIENTAQFDPSNSGLVGQVLKKTANGYAWQNESGGGDSNVKLFTLSSTSDLTTAQDVLDWTLAGKMPIIKLNNGTMDVYYCLCHNNLSNSTLRFKVYLGPGQGSGYSYQVIDDICIYYEGTTATSIVKETDEICKTWRGTQTQFDQLGSYENGVIYNILPNS